MANRQERLLRNFRVAWLDSQEKVESAALHEVLRLGVDEIGSSAWDKHMAADEIIAQLVALIQSEVFAGD